MFGYYIAQIGGPTDNDDVLSTSRINNRIIVNPDKSSPAGSLPVQCNLNELPFLPESIDVIVLLHELEFAKSPAKIIQEIYDALIPGGYLVVLSFNPYSLWGLAKLFKSEKKSIWNGKWLRPGKLRRLLTNAGFNPGDYQTFYFRPPLASSKNILFMEVIGQMFWQYCGASYMFVAQKTSVVLTPIQQVEPTITPEEAIKAMPKPAPRITECNRN